jgi:hypothetical protein
MLAPEMSFTEMKVPRRPHWDATTTPEELNRREKESFMNWRRDIAMYVLYAPSAVCIVCEWLLTTLFGNVFAGLSNPLKTWK